jgi:hypothetical protein
MLPTQDAAELPGPCQPGPAGWKTWGIVAILYAAILLAAAFPVAQTWRTRLPGSTADPMQHLWVMRWYKACLLGGRSPMICPELQYPVGAPLGHFSPMHLQALLYLPLSILSPRNDVACYNVLWFGGFLFTGLGTFALAWHILRDRASAALAGLLAMLGTPILLHSYGHLELVYLGGFPLFLLAWTRFVDAPTRGRLLAAVGGYALVSASAAYFAVLSVFPAVLFVAWRGAAAWRAGDYGWLRSRLKWLLGFGGLAALVAAGLFASQIWAATRGESLARPRGEFDHYGAPWWGYLVPTWAHRLGRITSKNPYELIRGPGWADGAGEEASYLGIVTIALFAYAALRRIRFCDGGFWWAAFALLVVLSLGSSMCIFGIELPMPSGLAWELFPPMRLIRVPARFNLFAVIVAAVVAAAAFKDMVVRLRTPQARGVLLTIVAAVAIADLSVPFTPHPLPRMPACYAEILKRDPQASFLEVPHLPSVGWPLNAACGYWQSIHHGKTSAGSSGHANEDYNRRVAFSSPFAVSRLAEADYLARPDAQPVDVVTPGRFLDYAWLYLHAQGYRYVVVHQWPGALAEVPGDIHLERLKALLAPALVLEDADAIVFDREKLPKPTGPAILCTDGWGRRRGVDGRYACDVDRASRLAVYNPDAATPVVLALEATAFQRAHVVRLVDGDREVTRWALPSDRSTLLISPPFRLPAGLGELTLLADSDARPARREAGVDGDRHAFSLVAYALCFRQVEPGDEPTPRAIATGPPPTRR